MQNWVTFATDTRSYFQFFSPFQIASALALRAIKKITCSIKHGSSNSYLVAITKVVEKLIVGENKGIISVLLVKLVALRLVALITEINN